MGRTSDARDRLIAAATELLWHYGYGSVSVDALCARAAVKKGSFYHFFASKDELVVAALVAHWAGRAQVLGEIFAPSVPPVLRLAAYFDYVVTRQRQLRRQAGRVLGCFHTALGIECIRQNPAIATEAQRILTAYRGLLEQTLVDASAEGLLARSDPKDLAEALFSLVEGALGQARIHDDLRYVEALPTTAWQLLGMRPPRASKPGPAVATRPRSRAPSRRPSKREAA